MSFFAPSEPFIPKLKSHCFYPDWTPVITCLYMYTCTRLPYSVALFVASLCLECTGFFFLYVQICLLFKTSSMNIFLDPKSSIHTHSPHKISPFVLLATFFFFLLFIRLLSFIPPLLKTRPSFVFQLCFHYIFLITLMLLLFECISFTCYSYFTIKWWETQRLLDKCITRKQETWQIVEA